MTKILAGINLEIECDDGCIHENVSLIIDNGRRIYLTTDGIELKNVNCINKFISVLPPAALAAVLKKSEGCNQ
jgi:hypothetical protein